MSRHGLIDAQWEVLEPLLPQQRLGRGRPRADNRKCLNGILYVLKTGIAWADLLKEFGILAVQNAGGSYVRNEYFQNYGLFELDRSGVSAIRL